MFAATQIGKELAGRSGEDGLSKRKHIQYEKLTNGLGWRTSSNVFGFTLRDGSARDAMLYSRRASEPRCVHEKQNLTNNENTATTI